MTAEAAFDALRAYKRELTGEALSQADVDAINAIVGRWKPAVAPANPTALTDESKFFAAVRSSFGSLTQAQVQGFQTLLQSFGVAQWPLSYAAYGLGTAWRETNETMEPVREAYWLSDDWRKANLKYYPWYGRGYVQLTWQKNYQTADTELDLAGALLADPDTAMLPGIAARIMVKGMVEGWFSGKKLSDYLPAHGPATEPQFTLARYIINGTDHASEIAANAMKFQAALEAGSWN